ncbi:phosphoribulokinase [Azospira sp. I13]|uniref:phosphoribulokinase n=1 Tax=Azospira sp. I13 TaxID=1765050 RepID=UPI000D4B22D0|nr:phosphoribulokinase [Azospira sp. I13]GBG02468.1 phosphoribulokinase [Azospira sp. I13]
MSAKHPIIAVTGSSGAGTSTVRKTFESIFRREKINGAIVEGDAFHRYTRAEMGQAIEAAEREGHKPPSHFGPEANLLAELEALFREYGERGTGNIRQYIHGAAEARRHDQPEGTFTPWESIPPGTDLLFYEGLHGAYQDQRIDVARHADLLIGVVPIINLEWIQKIHRDTRTRGYSLEAVTHTILRRMPDYVHHITSQFSRTHINFQRVPVVDTSNPFIARDIPSNDESFVVIRFRDPRGVDFPYLLNMIDDSFMSRPNTIVVPGGKQDLAMQLILTPLIWQLVEDRSRGA